MVRLHRQRTFGGSRWPIVFLILSISSQSLVFSAETIPGVLQLDPTTTSNESTTLVYSTTNDVDHNAAETTTSQSPEEEIFLITATKKVEKDTRQRQLRPVYYGTPSGMENIVEEGEKMKGIFKLKMNVHENEEMFRNLGHDMRRIINNRTMFVAALEVSAEAVINYNNGNPFDLNGREFQFHTCDHSKNIVLQIFDTECF